MAAKAKPDKPVEAPRVWHPTPVAALLPNVTRPVFRRRSPAAARLIADWSAVVGPALAAVTTPQRLVSGSLTLACSGPVAMELQHLSSGLIERINTHLGQQLVQRVRFIQSAPPPLRTLPKPAKLATAAAEARVATLPEGPLRDALVRLGAAVLARSLPDSDA